MKINKLYVFNGILCLMLTLGSCTRNAYAKNEPGSQNATSVEIVKAPEMPSFGGGTKRAMPKAVVYRTNGDFDNHVAVRVMPNGQLEYYPAPSDVSESNAPLKLQDGWLLDRQGGIGPNSRFLVWTYSQYHSMTESPTPTQVEHAIMPDARVTEYKVLPVTTTDAQRDTAAVNHMLSQPTVYSTVLREDVNK